VQQVNGSLVITNATFADEGEFQCFAETEAGVDFVDHIVYDHLTRGTPSPLTLTFCSSELIPNHHQGRL